MTTYTAPIEDMMFLYEKLRDNKNYNEIEKYNLERWNRGFGRIT